MQKRLTVLQDQIQATFSQAVSPASGATSLESTHQVVLQDSLISSSSSPSPRKQKSRHNKKRSGSPLIVERESKCPSLSPPVSEREEGETGSQRPSHSCQCSQARVKLWRGACAHRFGCFQRPHLRRRPITSPQWPLTLGPLLQRKGNQ